jgi:hypothetical protein
MVCIGQRSVAVLCCVFLGAAAMTLSIRLDNTDRDLLERGAKALRISKSEFVRRSISAYAKEVSRSLRVEAELDALFIGKGGGLRGPALMAEPRVHVIVERLRSKHGYAR